MTTKNIISFKFPRMNSNSGEPDIPTEEIIDLNGKDFLAVAYKAIGCNLVEHLGVEIEGEVFDFWMDEEGKLVYEPQYNITLDYDVLCGNLVVTSSTRDGDVAGLTDEQIEKVRGWVRANFFCTRTVLEANSSLLGIN